MIAAKSWLATLAIVTLFGWQSMAQTVTVTGASGTAGPYATLQEAFAAINGTAQTGNNILITIQGTTAEPVGGAILNAGAWTTLTINPTGGAAASVAGAVTAGLPLIDFNGADNVTVDGLNSGGNSLTITNTTASTTSGTSTIRFIGAATSNTITRCSVQGSFAAAVGTNGGNIYFATDATATTGNDNNTISYCDIGPAGSNLPTKGIYGNGTITTAAMYNSGIQILNNNIFDCFGAAVQSAGIYVAGGNTDWTISNNKVYQTATRTHTTGAIHAGIQLASTNINNCLISNNTVGYATSSGTGTYTFVGVSSSSRFYPIYISSHGTTTASSIQGNTVTAINMSGLVSGTSTSSPFIGIFVNSGVANIGNVSGNTIGSTTTPGAITFSSSSTSTSEVYGSYYFPSAVVNMSNNMVGGITASNSSTGSIAFYGLRAFTAFAVVNTMQNNTVGYAAAPISLTASGTSSRGIGLYSQTGVANVSGNIIRHITMNGPNTSTGVSASMIGLWIDCTSATQGNSVTQNTVHSLSQTAAAAVTLHGIYYGGSTTGTHNVFRNNVHSLAVSSATATMNGLIVNAGTTTFHNNMIRLGLDAAGSAITVGCAINGINEAVGTNNFYFNSVYIGGSGVASSLNTFALTSTPVNNRNYRNNIFYNARSNASGAGVNYAIQVAGAVPNPVGLTSDYNVLRADGTGGATGRFNALTVAGLGAWQAATGQDANSWELDPQFLVPDGSAATGDLHIDSATPTPIEGNGVNIPSITDDFDGETRASLTPEDIGADALDATELASCTEALGGAITPALYNNVCEGSTIGMTSVGATTGEGITYQWKVSNTSGSGYVNVSDGSGATSDSYTTGILALGTYYYVLETTCDQGPITGLSNEVTVNVTNPIPTGTASGPANGVNGTPYNFTLSAYTPGDLQWQTATAIGGPYTDYVGADSDMEALTFNVGTFYVRCKITSAAGCVGYSNILTIVITLANDNVCNALPLVEGYNGPYTNVGATVEPGEAQAPNTSCTGQTTWCTTASGLISNSIWFSLVAPAEGKVRINFSPGNWDSQIALWSAADCSDLLIGAGTLIAANDDSLSSPFNAWIAPVCLTPGETYFVQVDGYGTATNSNIGLTLTIVAVDEICNSDVDDDCDGLTDINDPSLVDNIYWYQDNDGDMLGNPDVEIIDCIQPVGYVADSLDCNDNSTVSSCDTPTNPSVTGLTDVAATLGWDAVVGAERYNLDFKLASDPSYPPATKVYTNSYSFTGLTPGTKYTWRVRANCDTLCSINSSNLPGGSFRTNYRGYPDTDADGYGDETQPYVLLVSFPAAGYSLNNTDCNDANSAVNPGVTEVCNGIDDDCDDSIDEGTTAATWYEDSDSDGLGNAEVSQMTCVQPVGYVSNSLDCNDGSPVAVCSVPSDVSVEMISTFSATIVWQSSPCVTFYGLQYKKSTDPGWTSIPAVYGDNYPLSGLTPGSLYLFRVRSRCSATTPVTSSAWVSGSFSTISLPMGLSDGEGQTENIAPVSLTIEVFPNPGDGIFNILLESDTDREASMKLTDNLGQLILEEQWQLAKGETIRTLDMSLLPVGIYQVQLLQGDLMLTKKIVLMK